MYGAIIGDIVGSRYEYDLSPRVKDFVLFGDNTVFTDDTVLTVGVAEALLDAGKDPDEEIVKNLLKSSLRKWGHRYPHAGYGGIFRQWLDGEIDYPYNSFGNGSAMRVSPAGWLYSSLEKTRQVARWTAEITHNHPEAVQGADAVASVIYLARHDASKREIREYVTKEFGYDLSESCEELRTHYRFSERCSLTVPPAIIAFLEGNYFEDVLRNAVSLGGDCDTLTDIACAMGEASYEIPMWIKDECVIRLELDMLEVIDRFYSDDRWRISTSEKM